MALEKHSLNVRIILIILFIICFPQWDEGRDLSVLFSMEPTGRSSVLGLNRCSVCTCGVKE